MTINYSQRAKLHTKLLITVSPWEAERVKRVLGSGTLKGL